MVPILSGQFIFLIITLLLGYLWSIVISQHSRYRCPSSNVLRGLGVRPARAKLESRFIQDVTVLDGTVMPPSTHFTKIWRLRNNGTLAWPFGTQLVWVGGDQFGDQVSTNLEVAN